MPSIITHGVGLGGGGGGTGVTIVVFEEFGTTLVSSEATLDILAVTPITGEAYSEGVARLTNEVDLLFKGYGKVVYSSLLLRPFEERMLLPFPLPALEACRRRALESILVTGESQARARALTLTARATELRSFLLLLLGSDVDTLVLEGADRNRLVAVDATFITLQSVYAQALRELGTLQTSKKYQDMIAERLYSASYSHRVSAVCAMVVLAALLFLEQETVIP